MAKVYVLNDHPEFAKLVTAPLVQAGHAVMIATPPIDFEQVIRVGPQVIVVAIYRHKEAFDRPIRDPAIDIVGFPLITAIEGYPALNAVPIVITGMGVREQDLPTTIAYDAFLTLPDELTGLLEAVDRLAALEKPGARLTRYACPECEGRLVTYSEPPGEMLCPRCDTTVVATPEGEAICLPPGMGGQSYTLSLDRLRVL